MTALLGTTVVVLGGLVVLGGQPILAVLVVLLLLVVISRVQAPLLVRVDQTGITCGWQWLGLSPKKLPWAAVQDYRLEIVSSYIRDGKTLNWTTQLPQMAFIVITQQGLTIRLGIDQVAALQVTLAALEAAQQ